jgi:cytochrome c553
VRTQNRNLPKLAAIVFVAAAIAWKPCSVPGQEHPTEHPQTTAKPAVSLKEVAQSIKSYVKENSTNGVFVFHDPKTGNNLSLKLEKVHRDRLSAVGPDLYFACADFKGADGHTYDLDFFARGTNRNLKVVEKETSVHKVDGKPSYNWHYNKDSGLWEKQSVSPGASREQPTRVPVAETGRFNGGHWQSGQTLFEENCAKCHGASLKGRMMAPSLLDVTRRMSDKAIVAHARKIGDTMCCARSILNLSDAQFGDIVAFLHAVTANSVVRSQVAQLGNGGACCCIR